MQLSPLLDPIIGFVVALVGAPAGISGAFLLLPFQVTVLGLTAPSVTSTNLVYNLIATPGGIERYRRHDRLDWSLAKLVITGSLPGVVAGVLLRLTVFRGPAAFKVFVGAVLVTLGVKLFVDVSIGLRRHTSHRSIHEQGRTVIVAVSLVVGVVGGVYGIGGGSIIAPYLVAIAGLSVYRVAGAALLATFVTSAVGVCFYQALSLGGVGHVAPDWGTGILFGIGGLAGSYVGAGLQRHLHELGIKALVGALAAALGLDLLFSGLRR